MHVYICRIINDDTIELVVVVMMMMLLDAGASAQSTSCGSRFIPGGCIRGCIADAYCELSATQNNFSLFLYSDCEAGTGKCLCYCLAN